MVETLRQYFFPSENVSAVKTAGSFRALSIFPAAKTSWPSFPSKKKKKRRIGLLVRSFESLKAEERYTEREEELKEHGKREREREKISPFSHHFLSLPLSIATSSCLSFPSISIFFVPLFLLLPLSPFDSSKPRLSFSILLSPSTIPFSSVEEKGDRKRKRKRRKGY